MKRLAAIAMMLGATLVAGCAVSTEGASLSEAQWVDNNCSGNGYIVNEAWCQDTLHASMGPYSASN